MPCTAPVKPRLGVRASPAFELVSLACAPDINPATRRGFDAEVLFWTVSHSMSLRLADELEAELEDHLRMWLDTAWPFTSVAYPGRAGCEWPLFEAVAWRDEAVPRIGLDATSVVMYNARASGLAREG